MKMGRYVVLPAAVLALAIGVWTQSTQDPRRSSEDSGNGPKASQSLPIRWMPDWLMEPVEKAIADAHDPHARKPRH